MSHRKAQLESTLARAVQQTLARGLSDPRASGALITVTAIRLADDLRNATVLVSILPEKRQKLAMHALAHAAAHIRHKVADLINLRSTPQLAFELDVSLKKQAETIAAIAKIGTPDHPDQSDPAQSDDTDDEETDA